MRFIIVTGMSGAGKGTSLKILEDMGYFCVDNLPVQLLNQFGQMVKKEEKLDKVATGIDIRCENWFDQMESQLEQLRKQGIEYEILFLDCDEINLIRRFKETRRQHPLSGEGRMDEGIKQERGMIRFLKDQATYIIDTSNLLTRELKIELEKIFCSRIGEYGNFFITVLSFGFKYGIPVDSDLVFDVRFLPNPYYDLELRPLTGNDKPIQDYVLASPMADEFIDKLEDMLTFLIPNYIQEGKNQMVISIGCTGGKHRSVTIANEIAKRISDTPYSMKITHRDIWKDAITKAHE